RGARRAGRPARGAGPEPAGRLASPAQEPGRCELTASRALCAELLTLLRASPYALPARDVMSESRTRSAALEAPPLTRSAAAAASRRSSTKPMPAPVRAPRIMPFHVCFIRCPSNRSEDARRGGHAAHTYPGKGKRMRWEAASLALVGLGLRVARRRPGRLDSPV